MAQFTFSTSNEFPLSDGIRAAVTFRDLAREVNFGTLVRHAQSLEVLGTMTSGIAHDLNNLLAPITMAVQVELAREPLDAELRRHLGIINESARKAGNLVRQILSLARKAPASIQIVPMHHILAEVVELLRDTLPPTIQINGEIDETSGFVEADPIQLQLAILNLCVNAEYAMRGKGGQLTIHLRRRYLDHTPCIRAIQLPPGMYLDLIVADTGHGMDQDTLAKIFIPFFSTKPPGEGTGLGLSAVHGIVASLKGGLQVTSAPGKGTTFRVLLPVFEREEALAAGPQF